MIIVGYINLYNIFKKSNEEVFIDIFLYALTIFICIYYLVTGGDYSFM